MKRNVLLFVGVVALGSVVGLTPSLAEAESEAAPIYGLRIPEGYRDWALIEVRRDWRMGLRPIHQRQAR
jgi:hypothetical protein